MKTILLLLVLCLVCADVAAAARHGGSLQSRATEMRPGGETGNG